MSPVSVASFNLHWGRHRRTYKPVDVVGACRALDADVLALQEVWRPDGGPSIAAEVATQLGYDLHESWTARATVRPTTHLEGRAGEPVGDGDWGHALLTRIPRGPVTEHRLDAFLLDPSDRTVLTTQVETDDRQLTVCTSHFPHLEHFSPILRWRLRPVLPPATTPAVLMGDLNMWTWVARFVVPGWRDAVRGPTWPAHRPLFQIDHLLVTPPVTVEGGEVMRVGLSDHLPIRARLYL